VLGDFADHPNCANHYTTPDGSTCYGVTPGLLGKAEPEMARCLATCVEVGHIGRIARPAGRRDPKPPRPDFTKSISPLASCERSRGLGPAFAGRHAYAST